LLFVPWVLQKKIPVLIQMHGSCGQIDLHDPVAGEELQGTLIRLIEKLGLARADAVQSYSQNNAAFWQQESGRNVTLQAPAFRSLHEYDSELKRSRRGLVVGRVQRWKGPQVLCEALQILGNAAPAIDWMGRDTVYGERGQTTSAYLADTFPEIWNRQLLHKPQQAPEITAKLQAQAEFIVVPSTWDVFNFTCVEAMAAGTPVICSTGAGASQWIEDGVNGFVFENENAVSLAQALQKFLALTETQRIELGMRGRNTVLTMMNPDSISEQRLQNFSNIINSKTEVSDQKKPAADWLALACLPSKKRVKGLGFLDHLPLKKLLRYLSDRSLRKIRGK
ncbi:MAG: glycosyltransferase family 4 protein, partial [Arenimonas sp.]